MPYGVPQFRGTRPPRRESGSSAMQLQKRYKPLLGGVAALVTTAGLVAMTIQPAAADPTRPYSATGSDTTQDVWNGLTNDFGAPIPSVASWNAFALGDSTNYIQTKTGGNWFERPAGSTNGVRSLSAVWDPAFTSHEWWTGCDPHIVLDTEDVDFARSSSGPVVGTGLRYIPFGRDALSIAYRPSGSLTNLNITSAEITELFTGVDDAADPTVTFSAQPSTASTIVSIDGVPVQPKVPQQGSGTRSFFQGAAVGAAPLAPYIADPAGSAGLPENSGTVLPNPGDLIGFSAGNWISQANGKVDNTITGLEMARINGSTPFTGTAPNLVPGALFGTTNAFGDYNIVPGTGVGVWNRDTYNVVPELFRTGTSKQQALVSILGTASGVYGAGSKAVIKAFGFGTLSYGSQTANWLQGNWRH